MSRQAHASTLLLLLATSALSCAAVAPPADTGLRGTLLLIGGGLDNDNAPVYRRFLELASRHGEPRIVVATAATGPQDDEATDKTEALRTWRRNVVVEVVRRETPTAETVAAIDAATAMFFTGGDQKRITDRYRAGDQDSPEWLAMQRLLARGGVIAGASAGDAMMGEFMFLTGGSARALGVAPAQQADGEVTPALGPQLGPGMKFLPWALTDSHFFERDRVGRLVAGLEASGTRLGIGVGEDAAVEIDLATGVLAGVSVSESLLVDAAHLQREGLSRRRLVGRVIEHGDRVSLTERLAAPADVPPPLVANPQRIVVPVVEPGQNRQLAAWRLFRQAGSRDIGKCWQLQLEGWRVDAWAAAVPGEVVFDLVVGQ